jgi:hypothetical protein
MGANYPSDNGVQIHVPFKLAAIDLSQYGKRND